jgi:subtilase family serine protease
MAADRHDDLVVRARTRSTRRPGSTPATDGSPPSRRRWGGAALAVAACVIVSLITVVDASMAAAQPRPAEIPGSVPGWAQPGQRVGDAVPGQHLTIRVYLAGRDDAGMVALATALSDPTSAQHRRWLTPDQVRARFAPTAQTVAAVRDFLAGAGFVVGYVPPNNQFVEATGTVAQAQAAFAVSLGEYRVRGRVLRAPDHNLTVPAAVTGKVQAVVGMDESLALLTPSHTNGTDPQDLRPAPAASSSTSAVPGVVPPPDGFRNAPPCSAYWGEQVTTDLPKFGSQPTTLPDAPCGYTPRQMRQVYGVDQLGGVGLTGSTATVAVIDAFASPTIFKDVNEYVRRNDPGHPLRFDQFRQVVFPVNPALEGPDDCDAAGWYGEETLDIEAVHAMAPGAKIVYVGGSDCQDISLDKALNEVVSKNLAQIVSNSYGDLGEDIPADEVQAFQSIAVQAVLQGIGVYFSSGDSGDEAANLGFPSADFSASSPWVTAVGGTSLGIDRDGHRVIETGWETIKSTLAGNAWNPPAPGKFLYGSGGGTSRLFSQPFYQRNVVPDAMATRYQKPGAKGRVVPDISMVGDPNTGFRIGITQTFPEGVAYGEYRIGGTSLSCPLMAGLMALADDVSGTRHGFINPVLYQRLNGTSAITDVKHQNGAVIRTDYVNGVNADDGTVQSIRVFDDQALYIHTRVGYDDTTGLGIPNGAAFLFAI